MFSSMLLIITNDQDEQYLDQYLKRVCISVYVYVCMSVRACVRVRVRVCVHAHGFLPAPKPAAKAAPSAVVSWNMGRTTMSCSRSACTHVCVLLDVYMDACGYWTVSFNDGATQPTRPPQNKNAICCLLHNHII
jgi:hypothetical protein